MVILLEKMTSRKQQSIASRQRILDAALRLTGERGFDNVTIQDICTEAGMSVGAFYHYFKKKEAIILAWYGLADEYFDAEVMPRLRASDMSYGEKIEEFAREQVAFGVRYGPDYIAQLYRAQLSYSSPGFYSETRGIVGGMIELVRDGQARSQLQSGVSAEQLADELLLIIRGVILDWIWSRAEDPQDRAAHMTRRYLSAYS